MESAQIVEDHRQEETQVSTQERETGGEERPECAARPAAGQRLVRSANGPGGVASSLGSEWRRRSSPLAARAERKFDAHLIDG